MDGLHHCVDDNAHILFTHVLTVHLLDEPCPVQRIQVVPLENHDHIALAVHQVQVLGIVLGQQAVAPGVGQGMHDGLLAGDIVAGFTC